MGLLHKPAARLVRHAFKTGLAAYLCLLLVHWMDLRPGYWAVISAVIIMQADLGGSLRAAWIRVTGTAVGGLVAVLLLMAFPPSPLLLGAAVFLTLVVAAFATGMQESLRMAGITAAIIILAWPGNTPPHLFGLARFVEILVGVFVGLGVSLFLWPAKAGQRLRASLASELRDGARVIREALECFLGKGPGPTREELESIRENLRKSRELSLTARREYLDYRKKQQRFLLTLTTVERMMDYVQAMADAAQASRPDGYQSLLREEIASAGEDCAALMESLAADFAGEKNETKPPNPGKSIAEVEARILDLRKEGAGARFSVEDIMHSFTFFHSLKSLSDLLVRAAGDAALLAE